MLLISASGRFGRLVLCCGQSTISPLRDRDDDLLLVFDSWSTLTEWLRRGEAGAVRGAT